MSLKNLLGKNRFFLIAEAGTAHNGSLPAGKALIDAARTAGAHAVKFQWVIAREILHPLTGKVELPGGSIPLFERFRELERPPSFYAALKAHCRKRGILFLCTPFGPGSARGLAKLRVEALKIASPELSYLPLLEAAARCKRPLFLSTGVTTLDDLRETKRRLRRLRVPPADAALLHCITQYPAREDEYNLLLLATLRRELGLSIGLSDHSADPHFIPQVAGALCALIGAPLFLEKHFTLDKKGTGLDDPIAIDAEELTGLAAGLRELDLRARDFLHREPSWRRSFLRALPARGNLMRRIARDFAHRLLPEYRLARVTAALGDGVKRLAPCEAGNYLTTRRSLRAIRAIRAGERLTAKNSAWLRSEKNLTPGIPAGSLEVWGKGRAVRDLDDGEAIGLADLRL